MNHSEPGRMAAWRKGCPRSGFYGSPATYTKYRWEANFLGRAFYRPLPFSVVNHVVSHGYRHGGTNDPDQETDGAGGDNRQTREGPQGRYASRRRQSLPSSYVR